MRLPRFPRSFSVRTLMLVVLLIGAILGWKVRRVSIQRKAIATIRQAHGVVFYHRPNPGGVAGSGGGPRAPSWLRDAIGEEFFQEASGVILFRGHHRGSKRGDVAVFAAIASLDRLEEMHDDFLEADEKALAFVGQLAHLKRLDLSLHETAADGLVHLAKLRSLEELDLVFPEGRLTASTLAHVARLWWITNLNLSELGAAPRHTADDLAPLRRLRSLVHLNVDPASTNGACLAHVRGLTQLASLRFPRTRPSDAHLANLARLTKLETVVLDFSAVTDEGLAHLAALPRRRTVNLHGATAVTDAGLERLRQGVPALLSLSVRGTKISKRALDAFHAARPEVALDPDPTEADSPPSSL